MEHREPRDRATGASSAGDPPSFRRTLRRLGRELDRRRPTTLQVNLGLLCNQACRHCHVGAGPQRREVMTRETAERIVDLLSGPGGDAIRTLDLTGGAPELNPSFRYLVRAARELGRRVIDRCNLTVLLLPTQQDTARFLARHRVEIVASLPCYSRENVEKQRGRGVFGKSVQALRRLNDLGYGRPGTGLVLNLVYNPLGDFLPPSQEALQTDYQRQLAGDFGVTFDRLLTLTNMPIERFRRDLARSGRLERYLRLLADSFNPETLDGVMCRELVSVGWDGALYDCDFNQALGMPLPGARRTIWDLDSTADLEGSPIAVGDHCYGCTAGAGSSCGGAVA